MSRRLRFFMVLFSLSLLVASAMPAESVAAEQLKVRVMIYSGRPDPVYVLDGANLAKARIFLNKAKTKELRERLPEGKSIIPSTLGYKGLLVENPSRIDNLPELFAVFDGKIQGMGKERALYLDDGRNLEKLLLKEAVKHKAIDQSTFKKMNIETPENVVK